MESKTFAGILMMLVPIVLFIGYELGRMSERRQPIKIEYTSPTTKCIAWDYGGKDGQRRCFQWRRT